MQVAHHHNPQAIPRQAGPFRDLHRQVTHNRMGHPLISRYHQEQIGHPDQDKEPTTQRLLVGRDPAREPGPFAMAPAKQFDAKQGQSDVQGGNVPGVADRQDEDHPGIGQLLMKQVADPKE